MYTKTLFKLIIAISLSYSNGLNCQELILKINSKRKIDTTIINTVEYQKTHKDSISAHIELKKTIHTLKSKGFYSLMIDQINKKEDTIFATIDLGFKIKKIFINIKERDTEFAKGFRIENKTIEIPAEKAEQLLTGISNQLNENGFPFSKVTLENLQNIDNNLYANLEIKKENRRKINKVIVKGYENFPKSYLKNYLNINSKTIFHKRTLKSISSKLNQLSFASEKKPVETLFKKDSTILYIYINKIKNNSFDGLINFNTNENGKVRLNGNIDLNLQNTFNKGGSISFNWESLNNERQELHIYNVVNYLFNLPISNHTSFAIYKQDSSFVNTNFTTEFTIDSFHKTKIGVAYESTVSKTIATQKDIPSFTNHFIGISLKYNKAKNHKLFKQKASIEIHPRIGYSKTGERIRNQFKIHLKASYLYDINHRNKIYIANNTGYINSTGLSQNELYRIGGSNSIRGFNEKSIFTDRYSFFNLEYRLQGSETSYLYTVTDIGIINNLKKETRASSIGLGYLFQKNNSQINISYTLGKINKNNFNTKKAFLGVKITNQF